MLTLEGGQMSVESVMNDLETVCGKIHRCRAELSVADLQGKYKKSFETLLQNGFALATAALWYASVEGLHYKCDREIAMELLNAMILSDFYQSGRKQAAEMVSNGDWQHLKEWLCQVRKRAWGVTNRCGGTEDREDGTYWRKMISETIGMSTSLRRS